MHDQALEQHLRAGRAASVRLLRLKAAGDHVAHGACRERIHEGQLWHPARLGGHKARQRVWLLLRCAVLLCLEGRCERRVHQAVHLLRAGMGEVLQDGVQIRPCIEGDDMAPGGRLSPGGPASGLVRQFKARIDRMLPTICRRGCLGQTVLLQAPLPQLADIGLEEVVHGDCACKDWQLGTVPWTHGIGMQVGLECFFKTNRRGGRERSGLTSSAGKEGRT